MRNAKYIANGCRVRPINDTDVAKMQIRTITLENEERRGKMPPVARRQIVFDYCISTMKSTFISYLPLSYLISECNAIPNQKNSN